MADERRQHARVPVEVKVEYQRINRFFSVFTKDISFGGTFIRTQEPLEVGEQFVIRLHVPTLQEPIAVKAQVRWIWREPESAGMGVQFVFDDDEERTRVEEEVRSLMVAQLGPEIAARLLERK
jgi:type IV pilus assembly protein PilZ